MTLFYGIPPQKSDISISLSEEHPGCGAGSAKRVFPQLPTRYRQGLAQPAELRPLKPGS